MYKIFTPKIRKYSWEKGAQQMQMSLNVPTDSPTGLWNTNENSRCFGECAGDWRDDSKNLYKNRNDLEEPRKSWTYNRKLQEFNNK